MMSSTTRTWRPSIASGARHLCVDEHILDLPRASGEPVARPPASYLKPWQARLDPPRPPRNRTVQHPWARLEPEPIVFAHRLQTPTEVDALRAGARVEQLRERRRHRPALLERAQDVLTGGRGQLREEAQH